MNKKFSSPVVDISSRAKTGFGSKSGLLQNEKSTK
jgi:hypothetical protein